jgi:hypothetical protein
VLATPAPPHRASGPGERSQARRVQDPLTGSLTDARQPTTLDAKPRGKHAVVAHVNPLEQLPAHKRRIRLIRPTARTSTEAAHLERVAAEPPLTAGATPLGVACTPRCTRVGARSSDGRASGSRGTSPGRSRCCSRRARTSAKWPTGLATPIQRSRCAPTSHLIDGGLGDADFLDEAVPAAERGKAVAIGDPQTAANEEPAAASETAS